MQPRDPIRPGSGAFFDHLAGRYDLLNRILSFRQDVRWRRRTVRALDLPAEARVLDLATGTADLALDLVSRHPDARVVGLDPSEGMLALGRRKAAAHPTGDRIAFLRGNAERLPFPDADFDAVTIAFGIRNVPDRPRALREMARVCRPAGRVAILELNEPEGGLLAPASKLWVHGVVPRIGGLVSGRRAYRYLQSSIERFPPPAEFTAMMEAAGLEVLEVRPLTFGVAHLFLARPRES